MNQLSSSSRLTKPGPATLAPATPSIVAAAVASSSAISRGGRRSRPASCKRHVRGVVAVRRVGRTVERDGSIGKAGERACQLVDGVSHRRSFAAATTRPSPQVMVWSRSWRCLLLRLVPTCPYGPRVISSTTATAQGRGRVPRLPGRGRRLRQAGADDVSPPWPLWEPLPTESSGAPSSPFEPSESPWAPSREPLELPVSLEGPELPTPRAWSSRRRSSRSSRSCHWPRSSRSGHRRRRSPGPSATHYRHRPGPGSVPAALSFLTRGLRTTMPGRPVRHRVSPEPQRPRLRRRCLPGLAADRRGPRSR